VGSSITKSTKMQSSVDTLQISTRARSKSRKLPLGRLIRLGAKTNCWTFHGQSRAYSLRCVRVRQGAGRRVRHSRLQRVSVLWRHRDLG
jgi:hypothetical protein